MGKHLAGRGLGGRFQGSAALLYGIEVRETLLCGFDALVHLRRQLACLAVLPGIDGELDLRPSVAIMTIEMPCRTAGSRLGGDSVAPRAFGFDARQLDARLAPLGSHGLPTQVELPPRLRVRARNGDGAPSLDEHA